MRPHRAMNGSAHGQRRSSKAVQGRFTRERMADKDHHDIEEIGGSHAGTREADLTGDGRTQPVWLRS